jgi:transposase InsO family protein
VPSSKVSTRRRHGTSDLANRRSSRRLEARRSYPSTSALAARDCPGEVISPAAAPNEEWSIDFKGWFRTADGTRCNPLTLTDAASRYLRDMRIVDPMWAGVRGVDQSAFARSQICRRRYYVTLEFAVQNGKS